MLDAGCYVAKAVVGSPAALALLAIQQVIVKHLHTNGIISRKDDTATPVRSPILQSVSWSQQGDALELFMAFRSALAASSDFFE